VLKGTLTHIRTVAVAGILSEQEVPGPGDANAGGFGFVLSTDTANELCIGMVIFGFGAAPTAAHVHDADSGTAGPVVITLATPSNGDFAESIDCYTVAPALATDLIAHPAGYYINVHTSQFPNGAAAVITDDINQCLVTYPPVTFTFNAYAGPQVVIHGWYLCDSIASNLTGMRYFEPGIAIPLAGSTMVITLELPVRGG